MSYPNMVFRISDVIDGKKKGIEIILKRIHNENNTSLMRFAFHDVKDIITLENEALQGSKYVDSDFNIS